MWQPLPALSVPLVVLLMSLAVTSEDSTDHQPGNTAVQTPSWTIGLRLYRALRADGAQNPLFSPLLLVGSLAAMGMGAGGTTAEQLQKVLSPSTPPSHDHGEALKVVYRANGTTFKLHSSLAVFTKPETTLDAAFLKEAQTQFQMKLVKLGPGDKQAQHMAVHTWAREAMGGIEGEKLAEEMEMKSGALILANAFHFKGLWDRAFTEDGQDLRSFLGTKYTKVEMMHKAGVYRHYEDMNRMVQVLELGMWGGKASMVLLLPFHVESLDRLERLLTPELLGQWLEKLTNQSLAISLPRAQMKSALNLQKYLSSLGLMDACDQKKADFSKASSGKGKLHLGGLLHWASLDLGPHSGPADGAVEDENIEKPKLFYADHSFIVLVKDNITGSLLLIGALDHSEGPSLHDEL